MSTRLGFHSIVTISAAQLNLPFPREMGGLIIAGSYVPKTTEQLKFLVNHQFPSAKLTVLEVDVHNMIVLSQDSRSEIIKQIADDAEKSLKAGKDTIVMTS